jgi:hypothetical protein
VRLSFEIGSSLPRAVGAGTKAVIRLIDARNVLTGAYEVERGDEAFL